MLPAVPSSSLGSNHTGGLAVCMVDVAVYGARGYLGRSLIGCLLSHEDVQNVTPVSRSAEGQPYGQAVPAFRHADHLALHGPEDPAVLDSDIAFLATEGGQATELVPALEDAGVELIVDLSRDHRAPALTGQAPWTYGLSELGSGIPQGTTHVANPGCYPTATLLALGPAAVVGALGEGPVISDGKSGVSGAGATPRPELHFPETNESVRAYKVEGHDHTDEIALALGGLEHGKVADSLEVARPVRFTPHLVSQNRGLLATVYAPIEDGWTQGDLDAAYAKAYDGTPFVTVVEEPDTAHVRGTNHAHVAIHLDEAAGLLVARGAIDNLIKGGAGNAVQAMNQALGLPETAGLPTVGVGP